ncbi:MAG: hypothetical protein AAF378_23630 [Cyanobacteria bacterium P01_A01_bin.84]
MPFNFILLIAALIVAWLLFKALLNFLKTALSTAITIFVILIILAAFGFSPEQLVQEVMNLPETISNFINGLSGQIQS